MYFIPLGYQINLKLQNYTIQTTKINSYFEKYKVQISINYQIVARTQINFWDSVKYQTEMYLKIGDTFLKYW